MFVGLSVHIWKLRFPVDWILQVEERIANIGIPLDIFVAVLQKKMKIDGQKT